MLLICLHILCFQFSVLKLFRIPFWNVIDTSRPWKLVPIIFFRTYLTNVDLTIAVTRLQRNCKQCLNSDTNGRRSTKLKKITFSITFLSIIKKYYFTKQKPFKICSPWNNLLGIKRLNVVEIPDGFFMMIFVFVNAAYFSRNRN